MRFRNLALMAAAVLLSTAVAGCAQAGSTAPSPVATAAVDLPPSYLFVPPDIAAAAATTVTWTNSDHFTHSVQFLDGGLPTDPLVMEPGEATTFTFREPGIYHYQCHLHPQNMRGSVTVTR